MCSVIAPITATVDPTASKRIEELEQEICELAAHLASAMCRWLLLIAEFDVRLGWAEWGIRSCAHWLSWRCSIGLCAAREHVRVGHRLGELPLMREAFAAGQLSYSKVRAISRIATPESEAQLVELARHATGAQMEKLVRGYRGALAVALGTARRAYERRSLTFSWDDDGSLVFKGRLPADEGALMLTALKAQAVEAAPTTAEGSTETPTQQVVTPSQGRADALVSLARTALADGRQQRQGGDPCELVVHVDAETLAADEVQSRSELENGPVIAPETVRRLAWDAGLVRIIERDGRPLSVGRRTRTISPAMRRALRSRDGGCRFPGCTHTRFLHAHHVHHWARGGATELGNLVQLCSYHHRLVHEGGFVAEHGEKGVIRFRRPDGRLIPAVGPVRRRDARHDIGQLEARNRFRGMQIDANTCRPLSAGDRLDYDIAVEGLLARALAPG
jgi:hypothetical protein